MGWHKFKRRISIRLMAGNPPGSRARWQAFGFEGTGGDLFFVDLATVQE
jgi:hypothetical protein